MVRGVIKSTMSKNRDVAYCQHVVDCFLALILQGVTEEEADRDYVLMVLSFAIEYAKSGRVNQELQGHIDANVIMVMAQWYNNGLCQSQRTYFADCLQK